MLFVVDPVPTLAQDLRALPPALGQPLFVEAVRPLRGLVHTPEGAWEAYREGRCLPGELRAIERALVQRFATEPEYGRLVSLGLAHTGRPALSSVVLTASGPEEEAGVLQAFWQMLSKSQKPDLRLPGQDLRGHLELLQPQPRGAFGGAALPSNEGPIDNGSGVPSLAPVRTEPV